MAVYPWAIDPWRPGRPDDFGAGFACTCEICGAEFISARKSAKYCGEECRTEAYNRRAKDRPEAEASPAALDPYRRLAGAIVKQVALDLASRDAVRVMDALCWCASDGAREFVEFAGLEAAPLQWLGTGQARLGFNRLRRLRE